MDNQVLFDQQAFITIGSERSRKFHILKFRSVMDRVLQYVADDYFKSSRLNFISSLSELKSAELLEYGTDFFWSSVHRLFNAFDAGNEMTEIMYGIFLQNAFDSFFCLLPSGSRLEFRNYGDDQIILLRLGVSIEAFLDWPVVIEKTGGNFLGYGFISNESPIDGRMVTIDTQNIPYYQRVKAELVADKIQVLLQRHQVLFESAYHYECNSSVFLGRLFYSRLQQAFTIISEADQSLFKEIREGLKYIVPLAKPGKDNHPSFASALLKQTIFLSLDLLESNDYYLAECIIHEFSHCQLYKVQDTTLLTKTDLTERYYYSPWRTDPRHLLGLVHGIYVFSCVIRFYQRLLIKIRPSDEATNWIEQRLRLLLHQVACAIRQVREDEIAPAGKLLIDGISNEINDIASVAGIDLQVSHAEMAQHQEAWKIKNMAPKFIIK